MSNSNTNINKTIQEKKNNILEKINELHTNTNMNEIQRKMYISLIQQNYLPEYWESIMQRDFENVSQSKKSEILQYMKSFISQLVAKKYVTEDNLIDVLEQLTKGIQSMEILNPGVTYAQWSGLRGTGKLEIDVTKEGEFFRHIIFHELTHCITPDLGNVQQEYSNINFLGLNGSRFIREIIAESTACDLNNQYEKNTLVKADERGRTSNWRVPYNRNYQQLGDEFLQTLSFINTKENNADVKRFRALTKMAINPNNNITNQIAREYRNKNPENGLNDLQYILSNFESIVNCVTAKGEVVDRLREKMSPYRPHIIIQPKYERNQQQPRITINPQNIANTGRNLSKQKPGVLGQAVSRVKNFFEKERGDTRDK